MRIGKLYFLYVWLVLLAPALARADSIPTVELPNPLGPKEADTTFLLSTGGLIVKGFLGVVGAVALAMFIYGGILWLTSGGVSEKIEKGKKIFVWSVIGLFVIFSSYLLVNFVITGITG